MFLGFGTSAWLSRLPDVRDDLGLTPATIGTMLLIASLGSLLTLPPSGPIVTAIGARASGRIVCQSGRSASRARVRERSTRRSRW